MTKQFILEGAESRIPKKIAYEKELNQEQLAAVLGGDGRCLVLAGAGSGKTRTITYRVAYLLEQGVDPSRILLLTFTNKASREMLERVERLLGSSVHGIWGGTFHSIANRILRRNSQALGYGPNFTILDADDAEGTLKLVFKETGIDPRARKFPSAAVLMSIISYARNTCVSIAEALELKHPGFLDLAGEIEDIARRYDERKLASQAMDFDDLLLNLLRVLENPAVGQVIASQFAYVLVDEYQDTNAIQARIVDRFASAHGNAFVVGDDAQSIYGFRGADVRNILQFPQIYSGAKVFKLLTNYRSTPEILELANASLRNNVDQFQKDLSGFRNKGERPAYVPCASARQEAQYVAEQLLKLHAAGTPLRKIAVLFRATSHSQQLEFELLKRGITYEYRGGVKLFERAHIKDVLAFLRIFNNTNDEQAWLRVLTLQPGIGEGTAGKIASEAVTRGSLTAVISDGLERALGSKAAAGWEKFLNMARAVSEHAPIPSEMIRAVAASAYQDHLEREYPNWKDRLEDLEQFALFAESYPDLGAFLADVSLYDGVLAVSENGQPPTDDDRVVCSTIHQAKGLEWDTVFIIHLADNAFPNRRALTEEGGMEEERRLFYVAVTRAERRLFMTYPLTAGFDALVLNRQSAFIDELDPRLYERVELVEPHRGFGTGGHDRRAGGTGGAGTGGWGADGGSEGGWDEPTIHLDSSGDYLRHPSPRIDSGRDSTKTAWKSPGDTKKLPPKSYLGNW